MILMNEWNFLAFKMLINLWNPGERKTEWTLQVLSLKAGKDCFFTLKECTPLLIGILVRLLRQ